MTRERWEVRAGERVWTFFGDDRAACRSACLALAGARRRLGLEARIVHVRTYRVEVVYAWRNSLPLIRFGWWRSKNVLCTLKSDRAIFADPLGKHSRKRARAAALAAKPAGPSVLVAIRRRVKEV